MQQWPSLWHDFDQCGPPEWAVGGLKSRYHPAANTTEPYPVRPLLPLPCYNGPHDPATRPEAVAYISRPHEDDVHPY
eukprot:10856909-Prorocentrum_lima.AAC.1